MFDYLVSGNPAGQTPSISAPTNPAKALDISNNVEWNSGIQGQTGWQASTPSKVASGSVSKTAQAANISTATAFAVPTGMGGVYRVSGYASATNVPTGATVPSITIGFTDADSSTALTIQAAASVGSVSAAGSPTQGTVFVNAKAGTNITYATASYAAGSGTALQYNLYVRVEYIG